ncbi:hypothetical protein RHMOL_Rhmol03G0111100 [Rhododendron molle]|uniref:Uncharacterized protein n=1 Tax=Rhododendron molle TaxID=49168 RepID=A0ACC0PE61_RHOML|nr:hypothetical protein RHMOL_Rhmol03G0111100 [Rhododendron molle]
MRFYACGKKRGENLGGFGWNKSSVPVTAAELVEAAAAREDEEADIDVAEDTEFACFLHETVASVGEGDLTAVLVFVRFNSGKARKVAYNQNPNIFWKRF